jgi:hypothetical protein
MNLPVAEMPLPIRFRPPAPMTDDEIFLFSARNEGDEPEHLVHPTSVQGTGPIAGFERVTTRIWE